MSSLIVFTKSSIKKKKTKLIPTPQIWFLLKNNKFQLGLSVCSEHYSKWFIIWVFLLKFICRNKHLFAGRRSVINAFFKRTFLNVFRPSKCEH